MRRFVSWKYHDRKIGKSIRCTSRLFFESFFPQVASPTTWELMNEDIFEADEENIIVDWDVSSYYPAIIINNGRYPAHLGKEFLRGYKAMFEKRLELKPLAKKDKRIKGIVGALKLAVNSVYGKSSDMQNWIYDRQLTMFTTITGELSLMMLIEAYELAGIHVISANTDGVTIMVKKSLIDKLNNTILHGRYKGYS